MKYFLGEKKSKLIFFGNIEDMFKGMIVNVKFFELC